MRRALCILIFLAALALRLGAANNDLWLDEILSLSMAQRISSPWEVITTLHLDNNHPLNTLSLYLLGQQNHWIIYRIPAVLASSAAVALAGLIARRWGSAQALTAMTLTGGSAFLITYGTDARGYAFVAFFMLLAFYAALRDAAVPSLRWKLVFALSCAFGFLSHMLFLYFYLAAVLWTLPALQSRYPDWKSALRSLATQHLLPLGVLALLFVLYLRPLQLLGGPHHARFPTFLQALSAAAGGPTTGFPVVLVACFVIVALAWSWLDFKRAHDPLWLFLLALVALNVFLVSPMGYARYYLSLVVFLYVLMAVPLARLCTRPGRLGKTVYGLILTLFLAGNAHYYYDLAAHGRGNYLQALRFMSQTSPAGAITLTHDGKVLIQPLLQFYEPYLSRDHPLVYVPPTSDANPPAQWYVLQDCVKRQPPPSVVTDRCGNPFAWVRTYPSCALSGVTWHVYRRVSVGEGDGAVRAVTPGSLVVP